ncbi:SNF7 family protein [Aspergillus terreus]|uniref:SNF7 family protein n=1 Tax=Aspergillus terreus TaxID=33178 RepID=A0A5M3Z581_ASPTE|nr:hypothetical protein ATETN484_0009055600 [Aspergillus terreus]GFF18007.1 SNF7 family protein [Aspergillus terreus]
MNIVEWAFGKRMTPAERLRKHQRALDRTQRELDRERVKLENQEKKLVQDIKKSAKNGQVGACKIQAKDLVRTRSMNRQMNLPALQRIAMEFERENEIMDERQEMMDDAIDEATGMEGEEEEGEDILKEIFDEIGVDLNQALGVTPTDIQATAVGETRVAQAVGAGGGAAASDDDLQARLDNLRQ